MEYPEVRRDSARGDKVANGWHVAGTVRGGEAAYELERGRIMSDQYQVVKKTRWWPWLLVAALLGGLLTSLASNNPQLAQWLGLKGDRDTQLWNAIAEGQDKITDVESRLDTVASDVAAARTEGEQSANALERDFQTRVEQLEDHVQQLIRHVELSDTFHTDVSSRLEALEVDSHKCRTCPPKPNRAHD